MRETVAKALSQQLVTKPVTNKNKILHIFNKNFPTVNNTASGGGKIKNGSIVEVKKRGPTTFFGEGKGN